MRAHLIFPRWKFHDRYGIKILLFDCRENKRNFSTRVSTEFFGIPFVKVVEEKGATRSKFQEVACRWFHMGKSDGSINRGKGMVAILKGGYTTNVSVIGEVGRYFYRSSKSGTRKSVVDYQGQEDPPTLWPKNFFHPRLIRLDPR